MTSQREGPAFYAQGAAGVRRDVRAVLHPPYTAWHLSYVVLGAMTARVINWTTLAGTLVAFFLAVGVAAHAFDELRGRPLNTTVPAGALWVAGALGLAGAVALGAVGVARVGWGLAAFIVVGVALVLGYNLELAGGLIHRPLGFALGWGAFPVLTAAYAESKSVTWSAVVLAAAAALASAAQQSLSTPARLVRRRATSVAGELTLRDGSVRPIDRAFVLGPTERALRAMSWAMVALAVAFALARRGW